MTTSHIFSIFQILQHVSYTRFIPVYSIRRFSVLVAGKGNVDEIYFPRSMSVISNEYDMIQTHLIITSKVNSTLISL